MAKRKSYIREIKKNLDKELVRSDEINLNENFKLTQKIVNELKQTLKANENVLALSAPQIGYNYRIFCIKFSNEIKTFINPTMSFPKESSLFLSRETCPSVEGEYILPRHKEVISMYIIPSNKLGEIESNRFLEGASILFQQQMNILDGVLISDFGLPILDGFDELDEDTRSQILDLYIQKLRHDDKVAQLEIDSNDIMKKTKSAITFLNALREGKVTLEPLDKEELSKDTLNK